MTDCDCNIITSRFPHSRSSPCFQPSRTILVSSRLSKLVRALRKIALWIEAVPLIHSIGGCSLNGGKLRRKIILKENMNGTKIRCSSTDPRGPSMEEKVTWEFINKSEIAKRVDQKNEDVCTEYVSSMSERLKIDPIHHTPQSAIYYCEHKYQSSTVCTVEVKGPKQPDETSTLRSSTGPTITYDTSSTTSYVNTTEFPNETPSLVGTSPTNSTRLSYSSATIATSYAKTDILNETPSSVGASPTNSTHLSEK